MGSIPEAPKDLALGVPLTAMRESLRGKARGKPDIQEKNAHFPHPLVLRFTETMDLLRTDLLSLPGTTRSVYSPVPKSTTVNMSIFFRTVSMIVLRTLSRLGLPVQAHWHFRKAT